MIPYFPTPEYHVRSNTKAYGVLIMWFFLALSTYALMSLRMTLFIFCVLMVLVGRMIIYTASD